MTGRTLSSKTYFRHLCWDCYFKQVKEQFDVHKLARKSKWFKKLIDGENPIPVSSTSPNKTFKLLFDITDEDLDAERVKFDTASLKSFVRRFGEHDGAVKYEEYRKRQAYTCSKEYMMSEHHMSEAEWKSYNQTRASTKSNYIARYGEKHGLKRWKEYCEHEKIAGCSVQWFIDKYGPDIGPRKFCEVNASKAQTLSNYIAKYGEVEGKRRFENLARKPYSNISQELFKAIDLKLGSIATNSKYAVKNDEQVIIICNDHMQKTYYVDYMLNTKIIEFNGDYWHANPLFYSENDIIDKHIAKDIWRSDKDRLENIQRLGYQVKIVWEHEYVENPDKIIEECCNFLRT